ncbi:hypothetical protein [Faecalimicrobium sp. JNUCC 81]
MKKKVYKDFDEVVKPTRVPKKLWLYEDEMKKKPKKWDECNKKDKSKR